MQLRQRKLLLLLVNCRFTWRVHFKVWGRRLLLFHFFFFFFLICFYFRSFLILHCVSDTVVILWCQTVLPICPIATTRVFAISICTIDPSRYLHIGEYFMNQTRSLAAVYFTHFPYFYFILIYIYSLSLSLSLSLYLRHRQKRSDSFSLCFQFDFIRFDFNFLILLLFVWLNAAAIFFRLYPSSPLPPHPTSPQYLKQMNNATKWCLLLSQPPLPPPFLPLPR